MNAVNNGNFDIVIVGHVSNDIMALGGNEERYLGGGVLYSSVAACRSQATVLAVTKASLKDQGKLDLFEENGVALEVRDSACTTSIRNTYHSADRERRTVVLISQADPFSPDDIPSCDCRVIHLSALVAGEIPDEIIDVAAGKAAVALDVQGVLRVNDSGTMVFRDWPAKHRYLPSIRYLKTDAAEAEVLTGLDDRVEAARALHGMGASEVMVTHGSEVVVCTPDGVYSAPITSRNLSGRTGRGDTCFGAYLAWRLEHDVKESLEFATALVSMKMESPGVYHGSVGSVLQRIGDDRIVAQRISDSA